jgi:hypothetical protein
VGVELDGWLKTSAGGVGPGPETLTQFTMLVEFFFSHGYKKRPDGQMGRLDPGDVGAEYRSVIGIPGGKMPAGESALYDAVVAANVNGMTLADGGGGPPHGDDQGEFVVYVYDTALFPFFRAENYHQFHTNDVLRRPVPNSYTQALKDVQEAEGRLTSTGCSEAKGLSYLSFFLTFALIGLVGCGCCTAYQQSSDPLWETKRGSAELV